MKFIENIEDGIANGSLDAEGSASQLLRSPLRADFLSQLTSILAKLDLTLQDAYEMLSDAGISLMDIIEVYQYITGSSLAAPEVTLEQNVEAPLYLLRAYEQQLASWYLLGGFDVNYSIWGW